MIPPSELWNAIHRGPALRETAALQVRSNPVTTRPAIQRIGGRIPSGTCRWDMRLLGVLGEAADPLVMLGTQERRPASHYNSRGPWPARLQVVAAIAPTRGSRPRSGPPPRATPRDLRPASPRS